MTGVQVEMIASQVEIIASQVEIIASQVEIIASQVEMTGVHVEIIAGQDEMTGVQVEMIASQDEMTGVQDLKIANPKVSTPRPLAPPAAAVRGIGAEVRGRLRPEGASLWHGWSYAVCEFKELIATCVRLSTALRNAGTL